MSAQLVATNFFDTNIAEPQGLLDALKEHKHIAESITQGDPELAEILMRCHISETRKIVKQS